jgi:hypothetical protein
MAPCRPTNGLVGGIAPLPSGGGDVTSIRSSFPRGCQALAVAQGIAARPTVAHPDVQVAVGAEITFRRCDSGTAGRSEDDLEAGGIGDVGVRSDAALGDRRVPFVSV